VRWCSFRGAWASSQYDLDEPIGNVKSNAIQSAVANFQAANEDGSEWKVRDIARLGAIAPRDAGRGSRSG
jgi:hypothetical protein